MVAEGPAQLLDFGVDFRQADQVSREAIGRLFDGDYDPITLIKLKELLEILETATDKAEDVANVLETVVLKNA